MSLLSAIIIGLVVGVLAGFLIQENYDLLILNICMGIVGAVAGDVLYYFSSGNDYFLFTLAGALSQTVGALIFVLIFSLLHKAITSRGDTIINPPNPPKDPQ